MVESQQQNIQGLTATLAQVRHSPQLTRVPSYDASVQGSARRQTIVADLSRVDHNNYQQTSLSPLRLPSIVPDNMYAAASTPQFRHTPQDAAMSPSLAPILSATATGQDLPPYDLLYALTDLFFQHINTWCPIMHRQSTLDALFGPTPLEEADRIVLHAIVATTLRFSADPRLNANSRAQYHTTSKQRVLLYGLENSSVKALQALVILALDILGDSNGPPGWNLLALITRSAVRLGLAVEATSASVSPLYPSIYTLRANILPEALSFIEDESRRRLFWAMYLLDRYATISTAFEFALDEREIDRKLPCRDDLFARNEYVETRWFPVAERPLCALECPQHVGSFGYYVEIMGILSHTHSFLKTPIDIGALPDVEQWQQEYRKLDRELNKWRYNLSSEYGDTSRIYSTSTADTLSGNKPAKRGSKSDCIWIMMHVTYHTAVIRLHSSAAYPTNRSPIFTPSYSAGQRCRNAVKDISALCSYVRQNNMVSEFGAPFAFSLWVAARLLLVHGSTIDHRVDPAIYPLVEALHQVGVYWKVAERYATLLSRVLEEYAESERAPVGANGLRDTPSTVKLLADMRRTAYDLDILITRQPPQPVGAKPLIAQVSAPAPTDMEYLDVFDFFNKPRLPVVASTDMPDATVGAPGQTPQNGSETGINSDFNVNNFMWDADSDWFMRGATT